jgi:hypothetical protein
MTVVMLHTGSYLMGNPFCFFTSTFNTVSAIGLLIYCTLIMHLTLIFISASVFTVT